MAAEKRDTGQTLRLAFAESVAARDRAGAVGLVLDAVSSGAIDIPTLYEQVFTTFLEDVGAAWQSGDVRVWEEHYATAVVRTAVEALYPLVVGLKAEARAERPESAGPAGSVLLALPSQEAHDLGLRMLADRFELAGWDAYYLGADTPEDEIVAAARSLAVTAVALSVGTHFHRVGLRHLVDQLREELPGVKVWVGGAGLARDRSGFADEELFDFGMLSTDAG